MVYFFGIHGYTHGHAYVEHTYLYSTFMVIGDILKYLTSKIERLATFALTCLHLINNSSTTYIIFIIK